MSPELARMLCPPWAAELGSLLWAGAGATITLTPKEGL